MVLQINETNIRKTVEDGERLDGRDFDEFRDITIEPDYVHETADGSAYVEMGDTKVIVGISTETGDPYPDTPDAGAIITNAELTRMAAPRYESGPPGDEATELARLVDRGIRESGMLDLEDLIIEEGETCWMVFIDIHVIDYDGNLIDAASLGAVTALKLADLPTYDEEEGTVDRDERQPLETEGLPMTVTGSKIAGQILFDTTADEEDVRRARLTSTIKEDGNVVSMQKGEPEALSDDDVMEILRTSKEKGEMLREKVRDALERA